jgi:hypothetical protein
MREDRHACLLLALMSLRPAWVTQGDPVSKSQYQLNKNKRERERERKRTGNRKKKKKKPKQFWV